MLSSAIGLMPGLTLPERTLVTGAGGQLGRTLLRQAPAHTQVAGFARSELDIADSKAIASCLDREQPDLLINTAAYTAVDQAEADPTAAQRTNAEAPGVLARACAERGIRFFHVSTDFVFDGTQSHPYAPSDTPKPLGVYGASKRAGEVAVANAAGDALILRTGWVYSAGAGNFLNTMLRLHAEREELHVVADQVGTPTAAPSLGAALWAAAARPGLSGIYHFSDAGVCSWYDFAVAIGEEGVATGLLPRAARVIPIATEDYPTPADRPSYSVLDKRATWREFELSPVHWRIRLRETLAELKRDQHV